MRTIFAKLNFFATMSQIGVAYSALKSFWAILTFPQICLAYSALKILENSKEKPNFFRAKDNLAILH